MKKKLQFICFMMAASICATAQEATTDLTPEGTVITSNGTNNEHKDVSKLIATETTDLLFFSAKEAAESVYGDELYVTDGTIAGTKLVKDINSGIESSAPSNFCMVGDILYFTAATAENGRELWKSDGTEAGTVMVKDVNTAGDANPQFLTKFKDKVLFKAQSAVSAANEKAFLWVSDGTEGGTFQIDEVEPAAPSTNFNINSFFQVAGDKAFFPGDDGLSGRELWVTDGETAEGTHLVLDIIIEYVNPEDSAQGTLGNGDLTNIFSINDEQVLFRPRPSGFWYGPEGSAERGLIDVGNEAWISDGTVEGTYPLGDYNTVLNEEQNGNLGGNMGEPVLYKNKVWFNANTNELGGEFTYSDGTPDGTKMFANLNGLKNDGTNAGGSATNKYSAIFGDLYYTVAQSKVGPEDDATNVLPNMGRELFWTNGQDGDVNYIDTRTGSANGLANGQVRMTVSNNHLYFVSMGEINQKWAVYKVNNPGDTKDQLVRVFPTDVNQNANPTLLTNMGGNLYFKTLNTGNESYNLKLIKYDDGEDKNHQDVDITQHYVPVTDLKNPYIQDYYDSLGIVIVEPVDSVVLSTDQPVVAGVYPNPASEYIRLNLASPDDKVSLVIYNSMGQSVFYREEMLGSEKIPVSSIPGNSGVYFVWIRHEGKLSSHKIILNRD